MKSKLSLLILPAAAAAALWLGAPASAPAQAASDDDPAVIALLVEVSKQQATLQDNQNKMDEQIAALAEDVRQARLFAARGGAHK